MLYAINEIFRSIQGEGYHVGKVCTFIRFAGCNLSCHWCDTDHSPKLSMDGKGIIAALKAPMRLNPNHPDFRDTHFDIYKKKTVVLTGGEPTLQVTAELLSDIKRSGWGIAIETNGTIGAKLAHFKKRNLLDWITVSPKAQRPAETEALLCADELKVVFDGRVNPNKYVDRIMSGESGQTLPKLYIQPCSENFRPAVDFVLRFPFWTLSIQVQKVIGVR